MITSRDLMNVYGFKCVRTIKEFESDIVVEAEYEAQYDEEIHRAIFTSSGAGYYVNDMMEWVPSSIIRAYIIFMHEGEFDI